MLTKCLYCDGTGLNLEYKGHSCGFCEGKGITLERSDTPLESHPEGVGVYFRRDGLSPHLQAIVWGVLTIGLVCITVGLLEMLK